MWNFPIEISTLVFSHLGNRDILQYALVCKVWKENALPFFYENLSLDGEHIHLVKQLLELDPVERDRHFQYGNFTKRLTIERERDEMDYIMYMTNSYPSSYQEPVLEFDKEEWILLLEYFPNIEVLDLADSDYSTTYLQYIYETESNKSLLKIQVLLPDGEDLSLYSENIDLNDIYFAICYRHRDTINTLNIHIQRRPSI